LDSTPGTAVVTQSRARIFGVGHHASAAAMMFPH